MSRAFKIEFHNGFPDGNPIVTMSLRVNNGRRFKKLDNDGKEHLIAELLAFRNSIDVFRKEIEDSINAE